MAGTYRILSALNGERHCYCCTAPASYYTAVITGLLYTLQILIEFRSEVCQLLLSHAMHVPSADGEDGSPHVPGARYVCREGDNNNNNMQQQQQQQQHQYRPRAEGFKRNISTRKRPPPPPPPLLLLLLLLLYVTRNNNYWASMLTHATETGTRCNKTRSFARVRPSIHPPACFRDQCENTKKWLASGSCRGRDEGSYTSEQHPMSPPILTLSAEHQTALRKHR